MTAGRSERLFGRDFVLLWQGQLVSQLGNQAFLVATMSWTLEATGSPALMGLLLMTSTLPAVFLGPIAGAIADRHSRRALIVAADLLRGFLHIGLAAALSAAPGATGTVVPLLVATGLASGILGALLTPALTAALPDLVPPRRLAAANSLHQISGQTATLVGQAAGGLAYGWIGAPGLILFDGITFVLSACCARLARVPVAPRPADVPLHDHARAYMRDVREGIAWLWDRPRLRSLILAFAGVNFLFTPVFVLLPVYVKDILGRGPEWYGFLLAAAGGGAMAGAALAPFAAADRTYVFWPLLGIGVCTMALGVNRSAPLAQGLLFALGLMSAIVNVRVMTTLQTWTPAPLRGRVLAVTVSLAGAAVPVGLGLGGLLGGLARPDLATLVAACGAGIIGVAGLFGVLTDQTRAWAGRRTIRGVADNRDVIARLLGTWTLVAMEGRRASGAVFYPWGTDVRGRLTYDASGHAALQIAKAGNTPFASDDLEAGTPEEVRRAFDGYHAWFGRFEVAADGASVIHRIEASLFPNWEGQEQRRLVTLSGNELVLRSPALPYGGEPVEFVTRWVRAGSRP